MSVISEKVGSRSNTFVSYSSASCSYPLKIGRTWGLFSFVFTQRHPGEIHFDLEKRKQTENKNLESGV